MVTDRIAQFQAALEASSLDGIALLPGQNLLYITGLSFHLMERPVVALFMRGETPRIILPELEQVKLKQVVTPLHAFPYGEDAASRQEAFQRAMGELRKARPNIGVEPYRMRFFEMGLIHEAAPALNLTDAGEILVRLRMYKAPGEVEAMQRAVNTAETALQQTLPLVKPGMSEKEFESELTLQLFRAGSEPELPFAPIVASGPNSALPHATPTLRAFKPGDLLIVDWGARVDGYISDITRTFAIGEPPEELQRIHSIVQAANQAGREQVRPGVTCGSADDAARAVIEAQGYGKEFVHRTGHGIGMDAHEPPFILAGNERIMEPGMAFTIEPGIYLQEKGGVRIEDNLVVTQDGHRCLTKYRRELTVLG